MDELDSAIVEHLQRDARQTNRDLARKLGIAPSTCLERVRALRNRGVITGYHAAVDLRALNRPVQALLSVQVRPLSREVVEGFKQYAAGLPEVLSVFVVAGQRGLPRPCRRPGRRPAALLPAGPVQQETRDRRLPQLGDLSASEQPGDEPARTRRHVVRGVGQPLSASSARGQFARATCSASSACLQDVSTERGAPNPPIASRLQ